jgi:hypothetical protein
MQTKRPVKTAAFLFSCHSFGNDVGKTVRGNGLRRLRAALHCGREERWLDALTRAADGLQQGGVPRVMGPLTIILLVSPDRRCLENDVFRDVLVLLVTTSNSTNSELFMQTENTTDVIGSVVPATPARAAVPHPDWSSSCVAFMHLVDVLCLTQRTSERLPGAFASSTSAGE